LGGSSQRTICRLIVFGPFSLALVGRRFDRGVSSDTSHLPPPLKSSRKRQFRSLSRRISGILPPPSSEVPDALVPSEQSSRDLGATPIAAACTPACHASAAFLSCPPFQACGPPAPAARRCLQLWLAPPGSALPPTRFSSPEAFSAPAIPPTGRLMIALSPLPVHYAR